MPTMPAKAIGVALDQLAGKEMSVGRYYQGNGQYLAAINRFRVVVEQFQTSTHIEEALYRLTEAYLALGLISEARTAAAVLGHNYPSSQWYKDGLRRSCRSRALEPEVVVGQLDRRQRQGLAGQPSCQLLPAQALSGSFASPLA